MRVVAPDGRQWTVRRRWLPGYWDRARLRWRRSRMAERAGKVLDGPDFLEFDAGLAGLALAVGLIVVLALLFVAVPLLLDLVVILLAVLLGGVVRTLLRRPWTVEAVSGGGERYTRKVVGWFASRAEAERWAEDIRVGMPIVGAEPG